MIWRRGPDRNMGGPPGSGRAEVSKNFIRSDQTRKNWK